jgi:hypothetical protein
MRNVQMPAWTVSGATGSPALDPSYCGLQAKYIRFGA